MPGKIKFGVYELDADSLELRKHGVVVRLQEQPLRVLVALTERPGEIVTREELQTLIWGKDTFVDFEQSLNKAVNRLRETLNDNAGQPRYVETVPRRGYRFVAPVSNIPHLEAHGPSELTNHGPSLGPSKSIPTRSRRLALVTTIAAPCLLFIVLTAVLWWKRSEKPASQEATHVSSFGFGPALSRDGKLLAYASTASGGVPHLWVQQTAGGEASPITKGADADAWPDFSPDGTQVVFSSDREGGAIYLTPTLPGEPRLVTLGLDAAGPRFSPRGDSILYLQNQKAFTVSPEGGQPVALPLDDEFTLNTPPFWSPDENEILFYGVRKPEQNQPAQWWIAPVARGQAKPTHLPGVEQDQWPGLAVRAWIRGADGREWIFYSISSVDGWKLWRIKVSSEGQSDDSPELLISGAGVLGRGGSVSEDGRIAYNIWSFSQSIYQISTDQRGQKLGATLELGLPDGGSHRSPSVSRDGRWMAYDSFNFGKPDKILLRDLNAGTDHLLDDKGRNPYDGGETSISPDGSRIILERDGKTGRPGFTFPDSFTIAAAGGEPQPLCEGCTPRGFSSDGAVLLIQKYDSTDATKDKIVVFNLRTLTGRDFLSDLQKPLYHAYFSWDDRWVSFKKLLQSEDLSHPLSQLLIAPVRHGSAAKETEWIAVTDGKHEDDKPQFSPDGNTLYFTSTRDGYLCIWAQRLNPATKHPLGPPFAFEHFHDAAGRTAAVVSLGISDLTVARDKILINLPQRHSDIWIMQVR
jgi:DNA-binding winged helix-turn-helix (wHTH) protein